MNNVFMNDAGKPISINDIISIIRQTPDSGKVYVHGYLIFNNNRDCQLNICVSSTVEAIRNGSGKSITRKILKDLSKIINQKLGTTFDVYGPCNKFCSHRKILGSLRTTNSKSTFKDNGFAFSEPMITPQVCDHCKDIFENNIQTINEVLRKNNGGVLPNGVHEDDDGFLIVEGWINANDKSDAVEKLHNIFEDVSLNIYDIINTDGKFVFKIEI